MVGVRQAGSGYTGRKGSGPKRSRTRGALGKDFGGMTCLVRGPLLLRVKATVIADPVRSPPRGVEGVIVDDHHRGPVVAAGNGCGGPSGTLPCL